MVHVDAQIRGGLVQVVREKVVEQYLLAEVKKRGGLCMKFVSPGWAGVPDRIVILNKKLCFVEVKRPDGRLSKLQIFTGRLLQKHGQMWRVVYNKEEVKELINELCETA